MRAVQITEFGGPEVLTLTELPDPVAGDGQLLVDAIMMSPPNPSMLEARDALRRARRTAEAVLTYVALTKEGKPRRITEPDAG